MWSWILSVFFTPARYRVVKITCSYSEVVLRTMKNYKAHNSLSWSRPLLRGNSHTSNIFDIKEDEQCYNGGELRAQEVYYVKGGKCSCAPLPEG
jgi:hypothetical protein